MLALSSFVSALHSPCTHPHRLTIPAQPGTCGRRAALLTTAVTTLAARPPAFAADGAWTVHTGTFDDAFFKGFTTNPQGFVYKFVQTGEGDKPEPFQKVFVHCEPGSPSGAHSAEPAFALPVRRHGLSAGRDQVRLVV